MYIPAPMQDLVMAQMTCDQMAQHVGETANSGHMLWAILCHPFSSSAPLLLEHCTKEALFRALEVSQPGAEGSPFDWAFAVAKPLRHTCVGTAHCLVGMLAYDCRARRALVSAGADVATLEKQLKALMSADNQPVRPSPLEKVKEFWRMRSERRTARRSTRW